MINSLPEQPPEGRLIERAREKLGISQAEAGRQAGVSGQRWRALVKGYKEGGRQTVRGRADTLARMARVVGLQHVDFIGVGRPDVALELLRDDLDAGAKPPRDEKIEAPVDRLYETLMALRRIFGEVAFKSAISRLPQRYKD